MSIDGIKRKTKAEGKKGQIQSKNQPLKKNVVKNTTFSPKKGVLQEKSEAVKMISSKSSVKPEKRPVSKGVSREPLKRREFFDFSFSSDELSVKKQKKKREKKKKHVFRRILICFFVILLLLVGGVAIWGNEIISKITGGQSGIFDLPSFFQESYVDLKTDSKGRTNVLVFGTSGYDMKGKDGDYEHAGAQLTDTIMVVSLDQKTGDVAMVNLPRDLKAGRTCTATGKINEVYWCNDIDGDDEEGGAMALVGKIKEILDIDVQYYIHVNWNTLVTVVDSLGGITVTVDEDIDDRLYTGIVMKAGEPTTLNGERALGLARARHGTELGDFSRGNSQQKILIALKDRVLEDGLSIIEGINIVNSLGDNVRTNISLDEMKAGMHILEAFDIARMRQIPLIDSDAGVYYMTTAMINNISYVIPYGGEGNYYELKKYVRKMLDSNPVTREGSEIEVLNGTDESGVASKEKKKLEEEGFFVSEIGDAPEGDYERIEIFDLNGEMPETKAMLEKYYEVKIKSEAELPDGVTSNFDFLIILGEGKEEE